MRRPKPLPIIASIHTMNATRWTVWMARIFGEKITATDSGCTVTMYLYKGKWYLTGCTHHED